MPDGASFLAEWCVSTMCASKLAQLPHETRRRVDDASSKTFTPSEKFGAAEQRAASLRDVSVTSVKLRVPTRRADDDGHAGAQHADRCSRARRRAR